MANGPVGKLSAKEIKELRKESVALQNDLVAISSTIENSLKRVSSMTGESTSAFEESFNAAKKLGVAISQVDAKTLASKKEQKSFTDKVRKAQQEATALEAKANRLRGEANNLTKAQAKEAFKVARRMEDGAEKLRDQAAAAEKITEEFESLNSQTGWIDKMADLVSEVPVLGKVFGEFKKASEAARNAASKGQTQFEAVSGLFGSLAIKAIFASLVMAFNRVAHQAHSLASSLDISKHEAALLTKEFAAMAMQNSKLLVDSKDLVEAQAKINEELGISAKLSAQTLSTFSILTERMGLSAGAASDLAQSIAATGGSFEEFSENTLGTVKVMNALEGTAISQKQIFEDISATSNATRLSMRAQGNDLARVAFEARKIGLTLQQQESIQSSLLDFESSIASELQAELLTGKQLNLERARLAALNNDQATLTAEIAKNIGTAADFGGMNVLQQEAIAKSFGMQKNEFADMLVKQEALGKMNVRNEKEAAALIKKRIADGASYAELVAEYGESELLDRAQNISMQEKMDKLLTKVTDVFLPVMVEVFNMIDSILKSALNNINAMKAVMAAIVGSAFFKTLHRFFKMGEGMFSKIGKVFGMGLGKSIQQGVTGALGGTVTKATAKMGSRLVPGLGTVVGGGLAVKDLMEGDYMGAGLNTGAAVASLFPGAGTGIAAALTAADIGREIAFPSVDDYIIQDGRLTQINPDDVNIGFKPGGPVESMLSLSNTAVVSEIKTSNNILNQILQKVAQPITLEMDGNKVGQSLNIAEHSLQ